jgi:hypothetical protein
MVVYAQYQRNVKCPQKGILVNEPDGNGGPKEILLHENDWIDLENASSTAVVPWSNNIKKPVKLDR